MSSLTPYNEKENAENENTNQLNNHSESDKKLNFFEMNLKFRNKINIDYTDFDFQKGEHSPKFLFRKRKLENNENNDQQNFSKENNSEKISTNKNSSRNNINQNINNSNDDTSKNYFNYIAALKISYKIKSVLDNYLDFVHESYFNSEKETVNNVNNDKTNNIMNNHEDSVNDLENNKSNNFKFSSLDLLINPLRKKYVFEMWNPYEIALFECCVCKFNKNFDLYPKIIKSKTKEDVITFYFYWKQSKFYKIWKNSRLRKSKVIK